MSRVETRFTPQAYTPQYSIDTFEPEQVSDIFTTPVQWRQEAQRPPVLAPDSKLKQSIFESYSPINEAERIQKLSHLSPELQEYYVTENLLSYFEEFAAEIRVKKLAGVLKDDGSIEILGTNVTDMYRHSAQLAGPGSREVKEANGLDLITQGLQSGNNRALWISPPKIADYGFVFTFIADEYNESLGGRPFREMLLRYNEDMDSIQTSRSVYQSLHNRLGLDVPDSASLRTADDFLVRPFVYTQGGFEDLNELYGMLDISEQDGEKSELFRKELRPYIQPMMSEYVNLIRQMGMYDLTDSNIHLQELESQCKTLIGAMFNTARIINRKLDNEKTQLRDQDEQMLRSFGASFDQALMFAYAHQMSQYQELTLSGGSNCPVTQGVGSAEKTFLQTATDGTSITGAMQEVGLNSVDYKNDPHLCRCRKAGGPHFHCPGKSIEGKKCAHPIIVGKGIKRCPSCGEGKKC